eukprot:c24652_g1_i1 orf=228-1754(+)
MLIPQSSLEGDSSDLVPHHPSKAAGEGLGEAAGRRASERMQTGNFVMDLYRWFRVMREAFGAPFLAVVIIVYGISQGYAGTMKTLASNYYWKDVQKLQPASTQAFQAFVGMPWNMKPIYGLISDTFPISGYKKWPYLALCGIIGGVFLWALALSTPSPVSAAMLMAGAALCTAFPDVVTDATVAERSRITPSFASDLQTLSWGSLAIGGLIGCGISGSAVHSLGPRNSFFLISVAPVMLLLAALLLPENRLPKNLRHIQFGALFNTFQQFRRTLCKSSIWKPALYIYLSQGALCPNISDAIFYWMIDPVVGPGFSEQFLGLVNAVGYFAMFVGVALYNCWFVRYTFRMIFFWTQVASCGIGLLDIILVTRTNLKLKIPDHAFVLGGTALADIAGKLQLMPMLVLCARLCPPGIEGTIFAFLMSVSNFGVTCGSSFGALLIKLLNIQREDYSKLWLAVLIQCLMRLVPLIFLFLLPEGTVDNLDCAQLDVIDDKDEDKEMPELISCSDE